MASIDIEIDDILYSLSSYEKQELADDILAFPTMFLWNWLMPEIFGVVKIDLYQAMGINFLTHILFKSNVTIKRENNDK